MLLFKDDGFDDTKLPIEDTSSKPPKTDSSNGNPNPTSEAAENVLASLEKSVTGKIKIWRPGKIYDFCRAQWKFLAPVFSADESNHDLEEPLIIPFVSKYEDFGEGSFGQVSKYETHSDHLKDPLKPVRNDGQTTDFMARMLTLYRRLQGFASLPSRRSSLKLRRTAKKWQDTGHLRQKP